MLSRLASALLLHGLRASSIPLFYINLEKHTSRNQYMQQRFHEFQLYRVAAIPFTDKNVIKDWMSPTDNFTWTRAHEGKSELLELIVTVSHRAAIRKAREMDLEYAIFMEDDPSPWTLRHWMGTLRRILYLIKDNPDWNPDWRLVRLQYANRIEDKIKALLYAPERPPMYTQQFMHRDVWGAAAYLLNKDGMDLFLNRSTSVEDGKFMCPSDHCAIDEVLNLLFPNEQIVPIPGLMHWRFFEGSAGGRTGKDGDKNDHFMQHAQNAQYNAWHTAILLERLLGYPAEPFLKQEWQLFVNRKRKAMKRQGT